MKYSEMKAKHREDFNKFPMGAAFGKQQFEEMMAKWGLTTSEEDCKKILSLGYGAYIRKVDEAEYNKLMEKFAKEKENFLANDDGLKDALKYEFGNQECGYTWNFEDAIKALGFSVKRFLADKHRRKMFEEAKQEYINKMEMQ